MKTYFVSYEEPCNACDGSGIIENPQWTAYWHQTNGHRHLPIDQQLEADEQWWAKRGYSSTSKWPPEEINCDECDGNGIRHGRVLLTEALSELLKNHQMGEVSP